MLNDKDKICSILAAEIKKKKRFRRFKSVTKVQWWETKKEKKKRKSKALKLIYKKSLFKWLRRFRTSGLPPTHFSLSLRLGGEKDAKTQSLKYRLIL